MRLLVGVRTIGLGGEGKRRLRVGWLRGLNGKRVKVLLGGLKKPVG